MSRDPCFASAVPCKQSSLGFRVIWLAGFARLGFSGGF